MHSSTSIWDKLHGPLTVYRDLRIVAETNGSFLWDEVSQSMSRRSHMSGCSTIYNPLLLRESELVRRAFCHISKEDWQRLRIRCSGYV